MKSMTLYVPVDKYWDSMLQMVNICYREQRPMEAEPYQVILGEVQRYHQMTGSAFYPVEEENGYVEV